MDGLKGDLLRVCEEYQRVTGATDGAVSYRIFAGDGARLERLRSGALQTITIASFERAMVWLSKNWPEGAPWPKGVRRRYTAVSVQGKEEGRADAEEE